MRGEATMSDNRNRAAIARERGGKMLAIELSAADCAALEYVLGGLAAQMGRCTQAQAVGYALREVAKIFLKKPRKRLDMD